MNVAQELGDNDLYNYDVLVKLLGERFDPASRVSASRSRFRARSLRHHKDADAFADALAELCRVGYPQSPPELRQELIECMYRNMCVRYGSAGWGTTGDASARYRGTPVGKSVDWSEAVDSQQTEENSMHISGTGHWFLEGWIGDHAVDFLVDSGSAVTAISRSFFNTLSEAGAPVGILRPTTRRLRGANGSQIDISGCSSCMVSFLGLRTEFPVLVCDLSTDAIIGTDTLGTILPRTLDIKNGLLFTEGGVSLQYDIAPFHHTLRQSFTVLHGRWEAGHCLPVDCWRD